MIAAAGLGSRLGLGRPKCLLEIAGKSLLERQLELLGNVPDLRIVVGFEETQVIEAAVRIRPDIIFVRNAAYRTTTTLTSYALGARGLKDPCLFMDSDILFEPESFGAFLGDCTTRAPVIAVTPAKTADAVFVHVTGGKVTRFSRVDPAPLEWANLCFLPPGYCETGTGAVFERLSRDLPLDFLEIASWEVDTLADYEVAKRGAADLAARTAG